MRPGSGMRAAGGELGAVDDVAAVARQLAPPWVSVSEQRGLANCPAMRPIFTTGRLAPKVSTTAICSSTRKVSRMTLAVKSPKLSAQSPPCSTKALPSAGLRQRRLEPARFAGEDERRIFLQARLGPGQVRGVGIGRRLADRMRAPGMRVQARVVGLVIAGSSSTARQRRPGGYPPKRIAALLAAADPLYAGRSTRPATASSFASQRRIAHFGRGDDRIVERAVAAGRAGAARRRAPGPPPAPAPRALSAFSSSTFTTASTVTWSWSGCQQS